MVEVSICMFTRLCFVQAEIFPCTLVLEFLSPVLLGVIKGLLSHRVRNDFLAVATLALGLLTRQLIVNFDFTGGVNGFSGLTALRFPISYLLMPTMNYFLVFGFVLLAAWLSMRLTSSRTGRVWGL
ncbi:MAG: hypothetical protein IPN58_19505 [Anaerolineales bacterium]|nr:hypothetical protein [Anaerolineales bacterium]